MTGLVIDSTGNRTTYRLIGIAMRVHNRLGPGYKEEVYERAFAAELLAENIAFKRQHQVVVQYDGVPVALFILALWVADEVVVEIKAFSHQLTNDELAQVINYLKATGAKVGLLFNFGRRKLEYRRVFPGANLEQPVQRLGRDNVKKG